MKRALAIATAVTALATFPLVAEDDKAAEDHEAYGLYQGGDWPTSWPKELHPLRNHAGVGRFTATFWRPGEDLVHFGIRFTTREEFEAAWPHLLKVHSKGAPIILRSGRSFWVGGTSHGVCVHQQPAIWRINGRNLPIKPNTPVAERKPLSAEEVKETTTNSIELFVDGEIVDLSRISLPKDTPIIDKRVKEPAGRENGGRENGATSEVARDDIIEKPASRKLRDFAPDDPVLSMYDHLSVEVTDPAKTEAIKKELAKYGRLVKGYGNRVCGADVYDDVDTEAARAALAKVDGVGETGTHKRGAYDKRIPDLEATLKIGKQTYAIDQADVLQLTFVLTNTSQGEPREFRSIDSSMCQLDLKLEGPGARSDQIVKTHESTLVQRGKVIRLEPGKSYKIPVTNLTFGDEYSVHQWKWTKPGEYTLRAAYLIGEVRYEAPPVKLEVVKPDPEETPTTEVKDSAAKENSAKSDDGAAPTVARDETTEKPEIRKLRDFAPDDPVMSLYDYLWVQVTDPAKTEAIKKELAKYGRLVKDRVSNIWGADVYNDADIDAARAVLAKLDGVGETGTRKRGAYDKRIPDLEATLKIGKETYAVDQADGLDLTFVLTNVSMREPREFRSVDAHLCQLDLTLEGPGAHSEQIVKGFDSVARRGKVIRLEPGKSYKVPVTNLKYGFRYSHQWEWTKPGEYTLRAAYLIGEVRYEAKPVKLTVVAN